MTSSSPRLRRWTGTVIGVTGSAGQTTTKDTIAGAEDVVFIRSLLIANGWLPQNVKVVTNRKATGVRAGEFYSRYSNPTVRSFEPSFERCVESL